MINVVKNNEKAAKNEAEANTTIRRKAKLNLLRQQKFVVMQLLLRNSVLKWEPTLRAQYPSMYFSETSFRVRNRHAVTALEINNNHFSL